MSGGEIILLPHAQAPFDPSANIICGNTCLYGATGGNLYIHGRAGERFAVRNSGAVAVVEGVGDHCCEYMTNGTIVILGPTGKNFGAGMSGGTAFAYDPENMLPGLYNPEMVDLLRITESSPEEERIQALIKAHAEATNSPLARRLLTHWSESLPQFWVIQPKNAAVPSAPTPALAAGK